MSLPRLFTGVRRDLPLSRAEHESLHGPNQHAARDLIESVGHSGLRGRGGASFPTAVKMDSVAQQRGPRAVLVNGAEGEPMSAKDRTLLQLTPHLVLDGAVAAADAVGARAIIVAIPEDAISAQSALRSAVAEHPSHRRLRIVPVPAMHLAGEESALIHYLNGGPMKPTAVPPLPSQRGLKRRPTLVQNPETLAHIALIDRHGAEWFREVGTEGHPGSALVTLAGAVRGGGVLEIACGTSLGALIEGTGGQLEPLRAVLVGGYHGIWISGEQIDSVTLDDTSLAQHAGKLGAGVVVALGRSSCPVQEVARTIEWLSLQSAGQCGPCSEGLPAIAGLVAAVAAGRAPSDAATRLERWCGDVRGRGACHLPDGAVRFLQSGLSVFADEFADHQRKGPCHACRRAPTLRTTRAGAAPARAAA